MQQDIFPNITRPPHDYLPPALYRQPMTYKVVTWDEQHKCTRYHEVVDAIDHEDAEQVVKDLHPEQKVLGTTHSSANENQ